MRRYFVVAYAIIGLLVFLLIAAKFDLIEVEALKGLKSTLRKGYVPELTGGRGWVNTKKPVELSSLKGKIVLLNFWTYCCINCRHTLEEIKKLEKKYPAELIVIGVHTGKFTNESNLENIRQAVLRNNIKHPVINDATFAIWHKYHINAWPTIVLINPEGFGSGLFTGEGNYAEIDKKISELIVEYKGKGLLDETPVSFESEIDQSLAGNLSFPGKVIADEKTDMLFIADTNHNRIVITDLQGKVLHVAGNGIAGRNDGNFSDAGFKQPQGMAFDGNVLYVADTGNNLIRELNIKNRTVKTIAGTGEQSAPFEKAGVAINKPLNSPLDLCLINNKLYIAMAGAHQIWMLNLQSNRIEPFAGNCREARVDGPLLSSSLAQPGGITTDGKKLYFADSETSSIRSADLDRHGTVTSIIGSELFLFGDKDGIGSQAKLQHPLDVHFYNGMLYVADTYNNKIKVIDIEDYTCKTLFGVGKLGDYSDKETIFYEPRGLTIANGKLYIADTNNHSIKIADLNTKEISTLQITGL